ncbi:MAG: FAD-dependent oxidoreductase [Acidimicrobiales bacterium]
MTRPTVAVVGSGVAGLTAAYVLRRTHEVTLYEADDRLGGHAHTHDVVDPHGRPLAVDTGFIVHNERTYPTLLRLFSELGVATQDTEMSLSVRCDGCGLEYAGGKGRHGLFPSSATWSRPRYLAMLAEVARFHRHARRVLAAGAHDATTLGEFLADGRYSDYFVDHFMTPVVAAVWSCGPATATQYPARYLFTFLEHHGMLSVSGSPTWRTVVGGSRTYVDLAVKELTAVRTATPIRTLNRTAGGVRIHDDADHVATFDGVVVATHPDQALRLLGDPTPSERRALGAFTYSTNPTLLHTDASVLPEQDGARASWNYRKAACRDGADRVQITYDMTRLQRLDTDERYLVSLNAEHDVDDTAVIDRMTYHHPQYTPASVAAQAELPTLNDGVTAFAGAYHGWGFHEDGARAGLAAARSLGGAW